jgi:hypothetical protein
VKEDRARGFQNGLLSESEQAEAFLVEIQAVLAPWLRRNGDRGDRTLSFRGFGSLWGRQRHRGLRSSHCASYAGIAGKLFDPEVGAFIKAGPARRCPDGKPAVFRCFRTRDGKVQCRWVCPLMQTIPGLWHAFGHWRVLNRFEIWFGFISGAIVIGAYALIGGRAGPRDSSSNGITIGRAKQFDNRALSLILEEMNKSLEKLSVLNQSIASRADVLQKSEETALSRSLSFANWRGQARRKDNEAQGGEPRRRRGRHGRRQGRQEKARGNRAGYVERTRRRRITEIHANVRYGRRRPPHRSGESTPSDHQHAPA